MLDYKFRLFYLVKPLVPRQLQLFARKHLVAHTLKREGAIWPIDERAATPPPGWQGWPDGKRFALVLTHDVESQHGYDRVLKLAELEERLGFRSVFNFVAEDYPVSSELREELERRGFEIGLHGLRHDGSLYHSRADFLKQAARINQVLRDWKVVGFRAPCMYHNLEWLHDLEIEYDASTFDTDPFEPQPDALRTIFPMFIPNPGNGGGYVELPYTLPQDFHLFVLMQETSIDIWKRKLNWLAENGGLALVNTHPDYMAFEKGNPACDEYPVERYTEFLEHIAKTYAGAYWPALPKQVARFWASQFRRVDSPGSLQLMPSAGNASIGPPDRPPTPWGRLSRLPESPRRCAAEKEKHPLRACMVAYTFYESDNRVRRYAEALARRGDEVDVIALKRGSQPGFERWKGVNLYRIQKRVVNEKAKLTYLCRLLTFLFRSFRFLATNHLTRPYDLIHVHNVPDFEVFAALVPKLTGAKVILDIHDILPEFYASKFKGRGDQLIFKLLQGVEKASCAFSDHVIVSNHIWMDRLVDRSVEAMKCSAFLNYPDSFLFQAGNPGEGHDGLTFLYPGTLNHHQGLDVAIRAFALIKEELPEAQFHIYGEGPETENLKRLTAELGIQDRVHFHAVLPLEGVAEVMRNADLGIVPKRASGFGNEAFSTKIFEFMALGVPVIVSQTAIDRYYFNDSLVKFFKPDDEKDLARVILEMGRNDFQRKELAANALRFIAENNWDVKQDLYYDLVDHLVSTAAPQLQGRSMLRSHSNCHAGGGTPKS